MNLIFGRFIFRTTQQFRDNLNNSSMEAVIMKKLKVIIKFTLVCQFPLLIYTYIKADPLSNTEIYIILFTGLIYLILSEKKVFHTKENNN